MIFEGGEIREMTFKDYQDNTNETAIYRDSIENLFYKFGDLNRDAIEDSIKIARLLNLSYVALGLGEVGEVQGKIKKIIRDSGGVITDDHRKAISKELGDILWYISQTCTELDISMEKVAEENLEKLFSRKERGMLKGSGDER